MPTIGSIIPVYNVEAYLPRSLDSVLNQTFLDFELILIDDESPDNCGTICDEYADRDSRIHVIHQENAKISAARNAGIDIASGEWIAFIDSDDWLHKEYLKVLTTGARDDTDVVICGSKVTLEKQEEDVAFTDIRFKSITLQELGTDHLAKSRVWGKLMQRKTIGDLRFIPGTEPTEDGCFNELYYNDNMKFRITNAKLYYYFMRPDSAIHVHFGRGAFNSIGPLLERLEDIQDPNKRRRIISRCYKYIFSARYGEMFSDDYADVQKQCKESLKQLSGYRSELSKKNQKRLRRERRTNKVDNT